MHFGRLRKILHILILNTFLNTVWCAINKDYIFHTDYPQKNRLLLQYFKQQFQNPDNSYKKIGIVKIRQKIIAFKTEATKNGDTYSELFCDVINYSHAIRLNCLDNRAIESTSTELSARAEAMEYPLAYCLIKINTGFYYYEKKNWPKYLFCLQQAFEKYNNCSNDEFPLKKYSLYQLALGHYQFEDYNKSLYFAKLCSRVNPDNIGTDMFNNHLMALNYAKLNQSDKANHLFKKNENDALKENRQEWFWISKAYIFMNSNNNVTDSLLSVYEKLKNYRIDNCLFELGTFIIHQNGNHVTEDIRVKNIISELNLMKRKISDPHLLLRYNESLRTYHRKYKNWPLMNQFADSVIEAYKNLSTIKNLNLKTQLETTDLIKKNNLKTLSINDLKNKFWLMTTLISVGLFLVIVIIITQVKKSQIMKERDQLLLASENLSLQNQLHEMQTKLNLFVQTKINKRNAIDELMRKFNLTKDENGNLNAQLIMELRNSTILTKYDWFKFREMFSAAYGNFLEEAETKLPDISQAELRYLALKKLQLKTPDMAKMMGISETSVRSIKSRLLKKYPEFNKIS